MQNSSTEFAVALFAQFIGCGVRDVVLCPGSRSQAIALAAAAYERAGLIRLRVRIDERVAGFLALGIAVETRTPVVIVTTSGTAVANLHPAVLEAHHAGVPLILLTADRPTELRGIGSNQTTDQVGIFGTAVGWMRDVAAPGRAGFDSSLPAALALESFAAAVGRVAAMPPPAAAQHAAGAASATAALHTAGSTLASVAPQTPAASRLTPSSAQPGPVQLNLAFREPLSGPVGDMPSIESHDWPESTAEATTIELFPHTVVIAGAASGPDAEALARRLGVPLIAEVSSGSRFGPNLIVSYRELLSEAVFGGRIEHAIVFGHPTLSREIPSLLQRADVAVTVVRSGAAEAYNPGRRATIVTGPIEVAINSSITPVAAVSSAPAVSATSPGAPISAGAQSSNRGQPVSPTQGPAVNPRATVTTDRAWLGSWVQASRALRETPRAPSEPDDSPGALAREQLAAYRQPVTRASLVAAVWRATWPHDRLVLGASRLIREADATVPGKKIPVHSNRGLAGIDGTIATAIGIALSSQAADGSGGAGITRVLLGDLAALYDVGALLFGHGETRPRIQVIVGNDGGGTIFDTLEVAASADSTAFDRVQFTPQSADFRALATAYGWEYRRAENAGELDAALAPSASPTLIEIPLPRE